MRKLYATLLLIFALVILREAAMAQQSDSKQWTSQSAKKWIKSKEWAPELKIKIHQSINQVEFAKQYHANKTWWDKAFAFLNDKKLDTLPPGKYIIDGSNIYATITEAPSKDFNQSTWESHHNYIDLQYVIRGKEKIGVASVSSATVIKPYDELKDAANYNTDGKYYVATPNEFFLFFPGDAHRPNIKVDGYDLVKKLVIKIRYTALQ